MTTTDLLTAHQVPKSTARARLKAAGITFDGLREVTPEIEQIILRAKPRTNDKAAQKNGAQKLPAQVRNVNGKEVKPAQDTRKKDAQPSALSGNFLRTDAFLFFTLCAAMIGQMIHTAGFCYLNSSLSEWPIWRIIAAVVCAVGFDCTALVATIRKGGRGYLIAFALIHFAVNIAFHLQVHESPSWGQILGFVLLSGVLAFSNFSYTDLFSRK